ncbi:hypothetical protein IWZ03DRAFT_50593 [Phyllosticta citriasiana]|uniref:Secreted protein n=1 Tax=Phyllosticta citriasiana TaxID=595635 RepID=A0ABR1KDY8_9PEZI
MLQAVAPSCCASEGLVCWQLSVLASLALLTLCHWPPKLPHISIKAVNCLPGQLFPRHRQRTRRRWSDLPPKNTRVVLEFLQAKLTFCLLFSCRWILRLPLPRKREADRQ